MQIRKAAIKRLLFFSWHVSLAGIGARVLAFKEFRWLGGQNQNLLELGVGSRERLAVLR